MTDKAKDEKGQPLRDPGPYIVTDKRDVLIIMTSDAQVEAILGGAGIPRGERKMREDKPGVWVTDLPAVSVPGLLAKGWIRRPTKAEQAAADEKHKGGKGGKP